MNHPSQSITVPLHTITLHIYRDMKEMNPPGQLSIEALHTVTLYIYIYISAGDEPPWSIDHRDLAYHYTLYI